MSMKEKYTAEELIRAAHEGRGLKAPMARILGCSYNTVTNYQRRYASVARAMHEEREKFKDYLEHALHKRVEAGDTTAIIFGLKTLCKDRGYVETVEVEGSHSHYHDGEPIRIVRIVDAPTREEIQKNGGKLPSHMRSSQHERRDS
jgi:hypothetical protein